MKIKTRAWSLGVQLPPCTYQVELLREHTWYWSAVLLPLLAERILEFNVDLDGVLLENQVVGIMSI